MRSYIIYYETLTGERRVQKIKARNSLDACMLFRKKYVGEFDYVRSVEPDINLKKEKK